MKFYPKLFLSLILSVSITWVYSQEADSLFLRFKKAFTDKEKYGALMDLGYFYRNTNADSALYFHTEANKLSVKMKDELNIGETERDLGLDNQKIGETKKAGEYFESSYKKLTKYISAPGALRIERAYEVLCSVLGDLGNYYFTAGQIPKALNSFLKALKIAEEHGFKSAEATRLSNIANIYESQQDQKKAREYNERALEIYKRLGDKLNQCRILSNMGNGYFFSENYKAALENYLAAQKIAVEINDINALSVLYANIASAYDGLGELPEAIPFLEKALKLAEQIGDTRVRCGILNNLGWGYYSLKKFPLAEKYYLEALQLAEQLNDATYVKDSHEYLSTLYEASGRPVESLKEYKLFILLRDSIYNKENTKKLVEAQMNFDFQKKESETKAAQDKIDLKVAEEKQRQKIIIAAVSVGLFLVLILALVIFRSLRQNQNKNRIITEQKEIVEKQKHLVEEKQKEVMDSIHYAKRIQSALMTSETYIHNKIEKLKKKV